MNRVESVETIRNRIAEIRANGRGFVTNFYLDEFKHGIWIQKMSLYYEMVGNTMFLIKISDTFWNVFYCSSCMEVLEEDLRVFSNMHEENTLMFDVVGRGVQCEPILKLFSMCAYYVATSLVRMNRKTETTEYSEDSTIVEATEEDVEVIYDFLHQYFNEKTEQIPYLEELKTYQRQRHILTCREDGKMAGFLIYEMNASTLYLRYWFTHPNYRDKKVGSRLLRRFFEDGKDTKRQLFWVIRSNENAIKRYLHYGFKEEDMFDYVLTNKKNVIQ